MALSETKWSRVNIYVYYHLRAYYAPPVCDIRATASRLPKLLIPILRVYISHSLLIFYSQQILISSKVHRDLSNTYILRTDDNRPENNVPLFLNASHHLECETFKSTKEWVHRSRYLQFILLFLTDKGGSLHPSNFKTFYDTRSPRFFDERVPAFFFFLRIGVETRSDRRNDKFSRHP